MAVNDYDYIRSVDDLKRIVDVLGERPNLPIAFDLESGYEGPPRNGGSLAWHAGTFIVGFSFAFDPRASRYVPLRHDFAQENLDPDVVWPIMKPLLEQPRFIAHNALFEKHGCRTVDIELGIVIDTMLDAFVLSRWTSVGLKQLVAAIFGHEMREIHSLFPELKQKERDAIRFNALQVTREVVDYACEDTAWDLTLAGYLKEQLALDPDVGSIQRVETEVMDIVADMEDFGVAVDWDAMAHAKARSTNFILDLSQEVREAFGQLLGRPLDLLNLSSPLQLQHILYDDPPAGLGMPVIRRTPKENPSTDEISLMKLAREMPAVAKLLRVRELENHDRRFDIWLDADPKDKNALPKFRIRGLDGRVHANYKQHVVGTGRFSASNPAIQQLPKDWFFTIGAATAFYEERKEAHKGDKDGEDLARDEAEATHPEGVFRGNFRDFIVPIEGCYLLGYDYSQIELRAIAGLARERSLLEAFERGDDVHTLTAATMLGKMIDEVSDKDRAIGKTMNFALIYQMGSTSLGQRLGLSQERAQQLYDAYFANFPSIAAWVDRAKREAQHRVPPGTLSYFGRRWTIWDLAQTTSRARYAHGERMAVNGPVQGWAADYMKFAMVRVARWLREQRLWGTKVRMIMNQHDALVFEVVEDLHPVEMLRAMRPLVEFPVEGFPEIVSEWEFGYRYGSLRRFDETTDVVREDGRWRTVGETGVIERDDVETSNVVAADFHDTGLADIPPEPEDPFAPGTVIVDIAREPMPSEVTALFELCSSRPGSYQLVLRTPLGPIPLPVHTAIGPGDTAEVSIALPGADVYHPARSVDMDAMAEVL
jgi:DNA polymerase-1